MKVTRLAAFVLSASLAAQTPPARVNPFLSPSTLTFQAPAFDTITDADYQPAIEEGIRRQQVEIAAIADTPAAPTFANTIEAMERSGDVLRRVTSVFFPITRRTRIRRCRRSKARRRRSWRPATTRSI